MYLVELDPLDGLVLVTGQYDGVMGIKAFRDIVSDKDLGRGCMTAIAFTADWLTPFNYYNEEDRPKRAMREVGNDSNLYVWNQDKIQIALKKYSELQYNPSLVEKYKLDAMLIKKLDDIQEEKEDDKQIKMFAQLKTIKELLKAWKEDNADNDPYAEGPVVNGYLLSRLEEKQISKYSFYNHE